MTSTRFLVSTAVCCGLSVGLAIWVVGDAGGGERVLAGLIALVASLAVMLLIAAAGSEERPVATATAPIVEVRAPAPPSHDPQAHDVLASRLAEARGLRAELQPGSTDPRVDRWITEVGAAIEGWKPGVAGYFNALAGRTYPDDGRRLDAYSRRLETIVRGY